MEQSIQVKYCFNLPNNAYMLCFNKLTGEHNAKKYFKKFSFCGSISLNRIFSFGFHFKDYNAMYIPDTSIKLFKVNQR